MKRAIGYVAEVSKGVGGYFVRLEVQEDEARWFGAHLYQFVTASRNETFAADASALPPAKEEK